MLNDNLKFNLEKRNYIDLSKKKLIINKHKTFKTYGQKVIDLDDDFIKLVYAKVGGYLFGKNGNGEYPYAKGDLQILLLCVSMKLVAFLFTKLFGFLCVWDVIRFMSTSPRWSRSGRNRGFRS